MEIYYIFYKIWLFRKIDYNSQILYESYRFISGWEACPEFDETDSNFKMIDKETADELIYQLHKDFDDGKLPVQYLYWHPTDKIARVIMTPDGIKLSNAFYIIRKGWIEDEKHMITDALHEYGDYSWSDISFIEKDRADEIIRLQEENKRYNILDILNKKS